MITLNYSGKTLLIGKLHKMHSFSHPTNITWESTSPTVCVCTWWNFKKKRDVVLVQETTEAGNLAFQPADKCGKEGLEAINKPETSLGHI